MFSGLRHGVLVASLVGMVALAQERRECVPEVGEKLGYRFVRVCPSRTSTVLGEEPEDDRPLPGFWIAAAALSCSPGEHRTIDCPYATALERSHPGEVPARRVAVLDATTAHRLCAMRFGGRLPTLTERAQARHGLGLATLHASPAHGAEREVRLGELPEWVQEGDCENPSAPGSGCRFNVFPPVVVHERLAQGKQVRCDATALESESSAEDVDLGGSCPASSCALRMLRTSPRARFQLRCGVVELPPDDAASSPAPSRDVAAFRCVLPAHAVFFPRAGAAGDAGVVRDGGVVRRRGAR